MQLLVATALDAGSFQRPGHCAFSFASRAAFTLGGKSVSIGLTGSAALDVSVSGSIATTWTDPVPPGVPKGHMETHTRLDGFNSSVSETFVQDTDSNGNLEWLTPPGPRLQIPRPGEPPKVSAHVTGSASLGADLGGAADAIFQALDPQAALGAPVQLASALWTQLSGELDGLPAKLAGACGLSDFPCYDALAGDLKNGLKGRVQDALKGSDLAKLRQSLQDRVLGAAGRVEGLFSGLTQALRDRARSELDKLGPLAQKAVDLLVLLGVAAGDSLRRYKAALTAQLAKGKRMIEQALWLVAALGPGAGSDLTDLVVQYALAARPHWSAEAKQDLQRLLQKIDLTLKGSPGALLASTLPAWVGVGR